MNRRSFLKHIATSTLALFGLSGGTYFYAKEIEPRLLTVHTETIVSPKIPKEFDAFKIAQFSDTHIGFHYSLDQFEQLVIKLNEQKPDLVVFTGDLVDAPDTYKWNKRLIRILSTIQAPYGKFWIYGNHDHGGYGTDIVKEVMDKSDFTLLQNSHTTIKKDNASFLLIGLDDVMLGKPDVRAATKQTNNDLFSLLLVHEPDYADVVQNYPVDVQLSGHSHGGQVQIPFFGHVYTPTYAQKYVEHNYKIGPHPLYLYVSRGIGTTRLPYRFLCKPEITMFELEHVDSKDF
ncbi:metallophosphoesterase [Aquibacillus sediminis]|uniref:metallophosphoesterase n=1 Tax=Aquibacillus sediminis TaxID=2574734 RepID=UPI001109F600|nr:metallophosphoesterase [Aquibacillus sediminis]